MKVLKPRSRKISVRLSEAEYEELCRLLTITGDRSLSDLTRNAMRLFLKIASHDRISPESMRGFQAQMDLLNHRIDELQGQLTYPEGRPREKSS